MDVVKKYMDMSIDKALNQTDYCKPDTNPLCYIFGVPCYDPHDYLEWQSVLPSLVDNAMAEIKKTIRDSIANAS